MLYLLDTNAVSDIQRGKYNVGQRMEEELAKKNQLAICPIVYYEIIRGLEAINAYKKLQDFFQMCKETFLLLPLDYAIFAKAAKIHVSLRRGQQIEDNDIYIAATAIVNGCTLVTANDKHFSRIDGLKVENWR